MSPLHKADHGNGRSRGEMEAAICDGLARFQQEFMGRGPSCVHTHLIKNRLFVHMQGVLSVGEQRLINPPDGLNGRSVEVLKLFRSHLFASGRELLEHIVRDVTGTEPVNLHHDISAVTGEEVIVFTLANPPACRARVAQVRSKPNR